MSILFVAIGGALGGVVRYLLASRLAASVRSVFPWGTLAANLLGSFLLGVILGGLLQKDAGGAAEAFLAIGFCGGLTTFSTFSLDALQLASKAKWGLFAAKLALTLPLCMGLVWLGTMIGGRLWG